MKVIIAGAGEVGGYAAEVLSGAGHSVTVIDLAEDRLRAISDRLDVRTLSGHCAHVAVLEEAGARQCDLMIAATSVDEINLLSASLAKAVGAKKTIVRVHHTANFKLRGTPLAAHLGIDELICPEHQAALDIARTVRNPGAIAIEEFAGGQIVLQRLTVSSGAPAAGKKLSEIVLPANARVATVEHGGKAAIAGADSTLAEGDVITLVGDAKTFDAALKLFNKGKPKRKHVAVMGDSSTAVWLCRALKSRIFSVRLFVPDHARAEELSAKLEHVTILNAEPTDPTTFAEEHLENVDAFVATTNDDERNILACAQAKALGVAMVIAVVQRATYMHLLPHVGIDRAFSPRAVAVRAISKLIDDSPVRTLATIADGVGSVYEVTVSKHSANVKKELRNIALGGHSMIVAIRRDAKVFIPGADSTLEPADTILVVGPSEFEQGLRKLFVTK